MTAPSSAATKKPIIISLFNGSSLAHDGLHKGPRCKRGPSPRTRGRTWCSGYVRLTKKACVLILVHNIEKLFKTIYLWVRIVSMPFKVRSLPIYFTFSVLTYVAIATASSIVLSGCCHIGRISKISTLCPFTRNPKSNSFRMWAGGRRFLTNSLTSFSHFFLSNSLSAIVF
jgi:hypothetical protein